MAELQEFPVVTRRGLSGSVFRTSRYLDRSPQNLVRLEDGTEFEAPSTALHIQPDGFFLLDDESAPEPSAPEEPAASAPPLEAASTPDLPGEILYTDVVDVTRVPVNRLVDAHPEVREEGGTIVVPVVEEVIVIEKRLMLKEEVRITRRRSEVSEPRRIVLDSPGTGAPRAAGQNL
jgi:hypothetical protein